jgi:hypothetical protein
MLWRGGLRLLSGEGEVPKHGGGSHAGEKAVVAVGERALCTAATDGAGDGLVLYRVSQQAGRAGDKKERPHPGTPSFRRREGQC